MDGAVVLGGARLRRGGDQGTGKVVVARVVLLTRGYYSLKNKVGYIGIGNHLTFHFIILIA